MDNLLIKDGSDLVVVFTAVEDDAGITSGITVKFSIIRESDGFYWDGSAFTNTTPVQVTSSHIANGLYSLTLTGGSSNTEISYDIRVEVTGTSTADFRQTESNPAGTGLTAVIGSGTDTLESIALSVDNIGSASGGALNFAATDDNTGGAIKGVTFVGVESAGTFASVEAEDGIWHQITHTGNAFDVVYEYNVGGGRSAVEIVWKGRLTSSNDEATIQAYNGSTWDTVQTINGHSNSAPSSSADNAIVFIPLLAKHTGTSSDLGKVFLRIVTTAQTSPVLYTDLLLVSAVSVGQSIGYIDAAVWVDIVGGTAGTENFVNGTGDNPVDNWADAQTIATSVGLKRFHILSASTITLDASFVNKEIMGKGYNIVLNNQNIEGSTFSGAASVTGIATGATAPPVFFLCGIGNVTLPPSNGFQCGFFGTFTFGSEGTFVWGACATVLANGNPAIFDYGAALNASDLTIHSWGGGHLEIQNAGAGTGSYTLTMAGRGHAMINANCSANTLVTLDGNIALTDSASGITYDVEAQTIPSTVDNATNQLAIKAKTDNLPGSIPRGVAFDYHFLMVDATDNATPETGLTVSATIVKDGGSFGSTTNSVSEIANGMYRITFTASELTAAIITFRFTASGAADRFVTISTNA